MTPIWHPSPNYGARRDGQMPQLVVLHYTAMRTAHEALTRLCDPAAEVSAHYLIAANGTVWQLVREHDRAWQAGAGQWQGMADVNSRSIGIELDNSGSHPFAEPQMARLEALLADILQRWGIGPMGVIGHSDMAPDRKTDPGPKFDWSRLARQGLARARGTSPNLSSFRQAAIQAGYPADTEESSLLAAVRLRYRPWARGPVSPQDIAVLCDT